MATGGGQIGWIVSEVEDLLSTYVTSTASEIATEVGIWGSNLLAVYFIFMGVAIAYGYVEMEVRDLLRRMALPGFVLLFILGYAGIYETWFVQPFMNIPGYLAGTITVGTPGGGGLASLVNDLWDRFWEIIDAIWVNGDGWTFPLVVIAATLVVGLPTLFFLVALILIAKIAIAVLLAVGPLFLLALLFNPTRHLFQTWLTQLMTFGVLQVLLGALGGLIFHLADQANGTVNIHSEITFQDLAGLLLVYGVSFILLTQLPGIAQGIGGGIGLPGVESLRNAGRYERGAGRGLARGGSAAARGASRAVSRIRSSNVIRRT